MKRFVLTVAGLAALAAQSVCAAPAQWVRGGGPRHPEYIVELHGVRLLPACSARGDAASPASGASYRIRDDVRAGQSTISTTDRAREDGMASRPAGQRNAVVTIGNTAVAFPKGGAGGARPDGREYPECPPM